LQWLTKSFFSLLVIFVKKNLTKPWKIELSQQAIKMHSCLANTPQTHKRKYLKKKVQKSFKSIYKIEQ
jgi:hypothetical protein